MALPEWYLELARELSNWGRWGAADERGTANLIDEAATWRGVTAVRTARSFSLAWRLDDQRGLQTGGIPGRINPLRTMIAINQSYTGDPDGFHTSDDIVTMGLQAGTHWDALAHVAQADTLYNGHPASAVTFAGARRCGIDKIGPVLGRAVLLDVARALGVERLEPGHAIDGDDLDAALALAEVDLEPGDIALIRTGQLGLVRAGRRADYGYPSPGVGREGLRWIRSHDLGAAATDNLTFEVFPAESDDVFMPIHMLSLVHVGLLQGQNWDLDALADDCAADGQYDMLLSATPAPFRHGVGGPVVPVATK